MKAQLLELNISFDWHRELATCSPDYYKWTQWLFLRMHKAGLAYQKDASVNWDPVDNTVLANEQVPLATLGRGWLGACVRVCMVLDGCRRPGPRAVRGLCVKRQVLGGSRSCPTLPSVPCPVQVDPSGRSWRSGAVVEQRKLRQWFLRITSFGDALVDDLDTLPDWPEHVKALQRTWIGRSSGYLVQFNVVPSVALWGVDTAAVQAFTTRPDTLMGVTFVAVGPDHPLVHQVVVAAATAPDPSTRALGPRIQALQRSCVATARVEEGLLDDQFEAIALPLTVTHPMTGEEVGRGCRGLVWQQACSSLFANPGRPWASHTSCCKALAARCRVFSQAV
jgi:leucyl-tRNA synthetase